MCLSSHVKLTANLCVTWVSWCASELACFPRCLSAAFAMILHSFCIRDTCTNSSVGFVRLDTRGCLLFRREGWGCVLLLGSGSCDLRFSEHFTWTRQNVSYSKCLWGFYMKLNIHEISDKYTQFRFGSFQLSKFCIWCSSLCSNCVICVI